jgi:hypothetical protein
MDNLVGHLCKEKLGLKNTYKKTEGGLLIPQGLYFFSDSMPHAIGNLRAVIEASKGMANENIKYSTQIELEYYHLIKRMGTKKSHDKQVNNCKYHIDEILTIASPDDSYGLVDKDFKGVFDERFISVFNAHNLRQLFEKVSQTHFDYDKNVSTGKFEELMSFWENFQQEFYKFEDYES